MCILIVLKATFRFRTDRISRLRVNKV